MQKSVDKFQRTYLKKTYTIKDYNQEPSFSIWQIRDKTFDGSFWLSFISGHSTFSQSNSVRAVLEIS